MIKGTVLKGVGGLYTVRLDTEYNGEATVNVRGRGAFRHEKLVLLTGDRVELEPNADGSFFCKSILERKNSLIRPPLANLDIIFVVIPCKKPMPSFEIIDKMISIAEHNKIESVIVITKSDLDDGFAQEMYRIYKNSGFDTFITSSKNGSGVECVLEYLKKRTEKDSPICAFAGASGAGKSTLMNTIFPTLCLETGDLSQKIERGKNTTRHTELFSLNELLGKEYNGYLADTPGFSLIDFERFDFFGLDDLFDTFREFKGSQGKCKYTKCSHTKEEGCDILARVKNGEIEKTRHNSYVALYEILKKKPAWKK
ncbi:MAG: ribosome small subunit-dependent GTPase A [Ruminococcaceae bacterium]|nr:ribosome small subunit-dependent GTPase A [Oscillospiraceae bacterium]